MPRQAFHVFNKYVNPGPSFCVLQSHPLHVKQVFSITLWYSVSVSVFYRETFFDVIFRSIYVLWALSLWRDFGSWRRWQEANSRSSGHEINPIHRDAQKMGWPSASKQPLSPSFPSCPVVNTFHPCLGPRFSARASVYVSIYTVVRYHTLTENGTGLISGWWELRDERYTSNVWTVASYEMRFWT